ncbi:MAG: M20/M25/M40 family metallo-hydrolase, partial [Chloroflexi bacterium]|nr:M20/M25/M40 family metallo-hydrolase [Chloroflexota bacterium]
EDGCMYGRGSADMKGALAAMIYGAASVDRAKISGRIAVSATVLEEVMEGVSLATVMETVSPEFVVIGEATELNLNRGGRGRAEIHLESIGKPAHSSSPHLGVNAVHLMLKAVEAIERMPMAASVLSALHADQVNATIAEGEHATYTGGMLRGAKFFPAWVFAEDHPFVQSALRGLHAAGLTPKIGAYRFCTNAAYSAGVAGVPTVGFGPASEGDAHIVDERLAIKDLLAAARGYGGIIESTLDWTYAL